jgi:flagellar basal-body rod protein FlgF
MIYGIYQSAAGLQIQEYRQSLIANNIANVDTPGYKPDQVAIVERPVESAIAGGASARDRVLDKLSGGLFETPVFTDFRPGQLEITDRSLDLAIADRGFFRVRSPQGERFTRDGRLDVMSDGTLVMVANGFPVLDRAGQPIRVDPTSSQPVSVNQLGFVFQGNDEVTQMDIVDFPDHRVLGKVGRNVFDAGGAKPTSINGELLRPGAVEQSSADPTLSMVQMIAATRAYEMNATLVSLQDQTLAKVVNDVGRLG